MEWRRDGEDGVPLSQRAAKVCGQPFLERSHFDGHLAMLSPSVRQLHSNPYRSMPVLFCTNSAMIMEMLQKRQAGRNPTSFSTWLDRATAQNKSAVMGSIHMLLLKSDRGVVCERL